MFTDQMAKRIIFIISFLNKLHILPFKTNRIYGKFYVDLWSHCLVAHSFLWNLCYVTLFLPENLLHLYTTHQISQFNFTVLIWICGLIVTFCFAVIASRPQGLCQLVNATYKYLSDFPKTFMPNYDFSQDARFNKILEYLMFSTFCGCCGLGAIIGLDSFIRPNSPTYMLYRIDERFISWPVRLLASIWFTNFAMGSTGMFGFLAYNAILFGYYYLDIIKKEIRLGRSSYKTINSLRSNPVNLIQTWRSIQILVLLLNQQLFYNCLMFMQALFTVVIIFCVVTLKYQWNLNGTIVKLFLIAVSTAVFIGWSCFLTLGGYLWKWSDQTIKSWKRQYWVIKKDWLYIKKFKRSCKPLYLADDRRYILKPVTVLLFVRKLSQNIVRAMVTYGKMFGG